MLTQDEIHAALGLAMQKIEAAGASVELTAAVTIVGDCREAVGNKWNPANEYAARRVRDAIRESNAGVPTDTKGQIGEPS